MIYQVKGISGYVWDMHGCVLVCVGVCGCARVCSGVLGCARVCSGVLGCARVCMVVHRCTQRYIHVCVCDWVGGCGMHGCAWVCVVGCEMQNVKNAYYQKSFNSFSSFDKYGRFKQ